MPINIEDVYQQKQEIQSHKFTPEEAYNRLLISRGYYASFLYACSLFDKHNSYKLAKIDKDCNGRTYGSHELYYESLMQSGVANLEYIGKTLKKYHKLRKDADYKLDKHIKQYDLLLAEQHFKECKERIDFFIKNGAVSFVA